MSASELYQTPLKICLKVYCMCDVRWDALSCGFTVDHPINNWKSIPGGMLRVINAGWDDRVEHFHNQLNSIHLSNDFSHCCTRSILWSLWWTSTLGIYSLSRRTSYRKISWSLEKSRFGIVSLWNLTGISVALLRHAHQISERLAKSKCEPDGFETSRDLAARRPSILWIEAMEIS